MAPIATKDIINSDGYSISGKIIGKRRLSQATTESRAAASLSQEHDLVLKSFRLLIADLCQQFNGGHPGQAKFVFASNRSIS
jgi:dihydroxyacetone synthase